MIEAGAAPRFRGSGLLAIFCDLEERWRAEFRQWLAGEMFPARLAAGFRYCASYDLVPGEGEDLSSTAPPFLTLYETLSLSDLYGEKYSALRTNRGERDRAFHQRMMGVERYTLTAGSPLALDDGPTELAPLAFVDRFDLRPGDVENFNLWYESEYAPWCTKVPGILRLRRYLAMEGAPRHFILHEFETEQFLENSLWRALRGGEGGWPLCLITHGSPALYRRVIQAP